MSILLKSDKISKYIQESDDFSWAPVLDRVSMMGDLDMLKLLSVLDRRTFIQVDFKNLDCHETT